MFSQICSCFLNLVFSVFFRIEKIGELNIIFMFFMFFLFSRTKTIFKNIKETCPYQKKKKKTQNHKKSKRLAIEVERN